jgi:hypothetical protein
MADSLLDALNTALDGSSDDSSQELEAGAEEELETGDSASEDAEIDAAGDETGDDAPAGADEEGALPEGEQKPEAKKEPTPEEKAAAAAAKPKDPVNDPLPNALKKETKERMESLIGTVKAVTGERDKVVAEQKEFMSHIEATGATPEQYSQSLQIMGMLNSGEPVKVKQAIAALQQIIQANARVVGEPIAGVDMLSGHADLQEGVADGSISQQHAEELAAARERNKHQQTQGAHQQQTQQREQQWRQEVQQGKNELTALGQRLSADPQFAAKRAILVPALQATFAKSHPSTWAASFEAAYNNLKLAAPARPKTVVPTNQPLRAKAGAGGAVKQPGSMREALDMGLGFNTGT